MNRNRYVLERTMKLQDLCCGNRHGFRVPSLADEAFGHIWPKFFQSHFPTTKRRVAFYPNRAPEKPRAIAAAYLLDSHNIEFASRSGFHGNDNTVASTSLSWHRRNLSSPLVPSTRQLSTSATQSSTATDFATEFLCAKVYGWYTKVLGFRRKTRFAPVAQLDRASDYGSEG